MPTADRESDKSIPLRSLFTKVQVFIIIVITLMGIYFRVPLLRQDILGADKFKQAVCGMMAKNFYQEGFNIFRPHSDIYHNETNELIFRAAELPIYQYIVAISYLATGETVLGGKIINFMFYLAGMIFLLLLITRVTGPEAGILAYLIGLMAPLGIYYSTTFQRVGLIYFSLLAFMYFWYRFLETESKKDLILSIVLVSILCLTHYGRVFIVIPFFLITAVYKCRTSILKKPWFYYFLPAAGIAPFLWLVYSRSFLIGLGGKTAGLRNFNDLSYYLLWANTSFFENIWKVAFIWGAGKFLIPFFIIGLFAKFKGRAYLLAFAAGCFVYMAADSYPFYLVPHFYYFVDPMLSIAVMMAAGIAVAMKSVNTSSKVILYTVFGCAVLVNTYYVMESPAFNGKFIRQEYPIGLLSSQFLEKVPNQEDRKIATFGGRAVVYKSKATGWLIKPTLDPETGSANLKKNGCNFIFVSVNDAKYDQWRTYLEEHYGFLLANRYTAVYDLNAAPSPREKAEFKLLYRVPISHTIQIRRHDDDMYFVQTGKNPVSYAPLSTFTGEDGESRELFKEYSMKGKLRDIGWTNDEGLFLIHDNPARITFLDKSHNVLDTVELPEKTHPHSGSYDPGTGRIAVTDMTESQVLFVDDKKISAFGRRGPSHYPDRFATPGNIIWDGDLMSVADIGNKRVLQYHRGGRIVQELGRNQLSDHQRISGFCTGEDGKVFVVSDITNNVTVYDSDGYPVSQLKIEKPSAIYYYNSENLMFVATWGKDFNGIYVYRVDWS